MNQYLIDYTVRNIVTGDEEDIRIIEMAADEFAGYPDAVAEEITLLVRPIAARFALGQSVHPEWDTAQQRIIDLLLPFISDRTLFDSDYGAWEQNVLDGAYDSERAITDTYPPEDVADAVRSTLLDAMEVAIENWREGYWEGFTVGTLYRDVLVRFSSFTEAWMDGADEDDPTLAKRIMPELRDGDEDLPAAPEPPASEQTAGAPPMCPCGAAGGLFHVRGGLGCLYEAEGLPWQR